MKVLLDENVPETVTPAFDRFETAHVNELGWQGKQNGALLQAARAAGFTVLVTTDVNLYNQQKARLHELAIIVLRVFSNAPSGCPSFGCSGARCTRGNDTGRNSISLR